MGAGLTCPLAGQRKAVRVAWGAVNGQVEQRRSLSLLACGAACQGRSARPRCALPDRCEAIRIAPQPKEAIHRRHRTGLAVISDNLLTVPQPAGLASLTALAARLVSRLRQLGPVAFNPAH